MDWFRFYSEVVRDPKVQKLSPTMFKHWINVLCLANDNEPRGRVPMPDVVAFHLRIAEGRATVMLDELVALMLLDVDEEGNLTPHNWDNRQYDSDRKYSPEERAESGKRGNHIRWHVKGGTPDPKCSLCIAKGIAKPIAIATTANRDTDTDTDTDTETETETEQRQTQTARAPSGNGVVEFHPTTAPPWPDEEEDGVSFASQYVLAYRKRTQNDHPGASVVAECRRLERDFGREACVQISSDHNWEKHPNWLRPKLEQQAKQLVAVSETPGETRKSLRYSS